MVESEYKRRPPESNLDFNMAVLNSVWGKDEEISPELKERLSKNFFMRDDSTGKLIKDGEGNFLVNKKYLWSVLGFYTRDMRLANINDVQLAYCSYYIDLASDFLQEDFLEPFIVCLSRSATVLELSQSRGGFLRKRQTTLTTEEYKKDLEPAKKSLITGKSKQKEVH